MIYEKEILWEKISKKDFDQMLQQVITHTKLTTKGINFLNQSLKINVGYDNSDFDTELKEKFILSRPHDKKIPRLIFARYRKSFGFQLPFDQYGYVSEDNKQAIVFASSFGVFKSVISGFASYCLENKRCFPVHGSVFAVNNKGLILTGGTLAGKTTTLINLVDMSLKSGQKVEILTDDWAVMHKTLEGYNAFTFDHSVSLKEKDLFQNPLLHFHKHEYLKELLHQRTKISMKPENLYGLPVGASTIRINIVILLEPKPGSNNLKKIRADKFATRVIDAAYHYPYISKDQIEHHKNFWLELTKEIGVFSFSTRTTEGKFQNLKKIRGLIM